MKRIARFIGIWIAFISFLVAFVSPVPNAPEWYRWIEKGCCSILFFGAIWILCVAFWQLAKE